jgi:Surface antigen variable number repeat
MYLLLAFLLSISTLLIGQAAPQSVKLSVASVGITSDSLVSSEHLQQIQQEIANREYPATAEDEIAQVARYELLKDGYFKAEVSISDVTVLSETPGQRTVTVTLQINEGQQYRLARITFKHNTVFPSSQLRQAFSVKDGDLFDAEKIRLGIGELRRLYASQGYINFTPVPLTTANDQAATVALVMDIDEGKPFKVEGLILSGNKPWSEKETQELRAIWLPYVGGTSIPELIDQLHVATAAMFPGVDTRNLIDLEQHADRQIVNIRIVRPPNR